MQYWTNGADGLFHLALYRLKNKCVCIQAQLLEGVRWDPSATEVSQGGGSEAQQSDKWKVLQVQPTRRQTVLLQCPQPAPDAPG